MIEYLLKVNLKYVMTTDIARLFRNSNNTHQKVEKGEGKESKAFYLFSTSLMKATFYFLIVAYCFF